MEKPKNTNPKPGYYNYGNSKNKYQKIGNQWYISNDVTDFKFQPIHDPIGNRAKELNKNAKVDPHPWIQNPKTIEGKLNARMGDPQGQSARTSAFYARPGEDDVDNLRHADAARRTQQAIAKATGSNLLGYFGSVGLGVGHELGTMFTDPRPWGVVTQEAYEDIKNNNLGATMGYNNTPNATKRLNYLSQTYQMPDGYGAVKPFPGSNWTDPYDEIEREKAQREVWNNPNPKPVGLTEKFADGGPLHDRDINGKLLQSTYASALGNMYREGGPFGEDQGVFDYATSIYASQPGNYYAQGGMIKRADGSYSQRGLWDNIRAATAKNRAAGKPGKEPSKEMLRQGEKINREYRTGGQFPRPYSLPEDSFKQGGTNLHNSVYASSSAPYPGIYAEGGPLNDKTLPNLNQAMNVSAESFNRSKPNSVLAYNPYAEATRTPNPSAYIRPNYYTPNNNYKYGFVQPTGGNIMGGAGYGIPKRGLEGNLFGLAPAEKNPYFKGFYSAGLSKQIGANKIGLSVGSPVTGYTDEAGFHPNKLQLEPQISFKRTFADGGPLLPPDNAPAGTPFNLANRNSWMGNYGMIPQGHNLSLPLTSLPGIGNQIASGAATANFKTVGDYVSAAENWERNQAGSPIAPGPVNINAVIPSTPPIPEVAKTNYYTDPYTGQVVKDFNPTTGVATPREIPNSFGNTQYANYLEKVANSPVAKENQQAINSERLNNIELLKTMTPEQKAAMRAAGLTPAQYLADPFSAGATKFAEGGELVVAGGEKHKIYKKTSPTGNGEGMEGHIMVNHPTMDKGQWDTIDLTTKAGAKTVADGITATKQWHKENPNVYRDGGSVFYASNTPQLEGEGKDLTYPDGAYVYGRGGVIKTSQLFAGGGPIFPTNQQLAQFLNPEYQRVTEGQEVTVRPNAYQLQQAKNKAAGINKYDAINIKPQVAESTKPNIAPVDKKVLDKAIAQKTAERKVIAKGIKNSPTLTQEQEQEILMSPQKLDENDHLAYPKNPDVLKAAKEYTAGDKVTNILRNPLVAASYFMKPGAFNMPMNYSELERSPNYSDETWNRNAAGQGLNFASYFHPAGLALHMADNALYTETDLDKALESGKTEDWKQVGLSAANTVLDAVGSRYIGGSGRLLNVGEQATLNAMNTSNRLGLNPSVNNFLSTRVFPKISSSVVRSADDIAAARLIPQINPNNINYNPLARNLYNNAVTAGNVQNTLEATKTSKSIIPSIQTPYIDEIIGSFKNKNRTAQLKEAEDWTNSWVQHPATQEKILNSYKKALEGKTLTSTEKYNLGEAMGYSANYNAQNRLGEYPLLGQGLGRRNIHSDNAGISYTHYESPGQILPEPTNTFNSSKIFKELIKELDPMEIENLRVQDPTYGNWISRTLGEEQRISTGVHELSHDWVKDYVLKNTELSKELTSGLDDFRIQEIIDKYKGTKLEDKALKELEYFEDPTELFARLMESRRYFNISPGQNVTPKQVGEYLDLISAGKTPIDHVFGQIISRGKKGVDFFNNPWLWTGVGIGGAGLGNKLLQNNGSDQNSSGQFKMGGQARVIKSSQLFNR